MATGAGSGFGVSGLVVVVAGFEVFRADGTLAAASDTGGSLTTGISSGYVSTTRGGGGGGKSSGITGSVRACTFAQPAVATARHDTNSINWTLDTGSILQVLNLAQVR
jgi:hypothetical protein